MMILRKTRRRAEGELRGCFAKAARASLSFCCAVDEVFPIRTREKREIFRKRAKKGILSKSFFSCSDFEMVSSSSSRT